MNVDLTQDDLKRIVNYISSPDAPMDEEDFKLKVKLTRYVIPDIDENKIAEQWQEWKKPIDKRSK
jgi:hypothetical protein